MAEISLSPQPAEISNHFLALNIFKTVKATDILKPEQ